MLDICLEVLLELDLKSLTETPSGLVVVKGAVGRLLDLVNEHWEKDPLDICMDIESYCICQESGLILIQSTEKIVHRGNLSHILAHVRGKRVIITIDLRTPKREMYAMHII
ncbi:MAG: hypothetical protein AB9915_02930 [Candidatus Dojkabacteria bacterium]